MKTPWGNGEKIEKIIEELENRIRKGTGRRGNKGKEISATGILKKGPGVSETHFLLDINTQEIMYALKSEAIDLSKYINDEVKIEGRVIPSGIKTGATSVNVFDFLLIEDRDENKENQGGTSTSFYEIGNDSDDSWRWK